ncbi:MAG: Na+/H+ antiporter subunit E [Myxococcales bacterium]
MRRLFPSPVLSVALLLFWLLLMQSSSADTVVLGAALAIFWPVATARLRPGRVRIRRPVVMVRLFRDVVIDMLRSNVRVARAILTQRSSGMRSAFVEIPLELKDPNGLAVLAMIVTFTPGTAWVQLSADRRVLLLHILDLDDEASLIQLVKRRYERALMEVFQ